MRDANDEPLIPIRIEHHDDGAVSVLLILGGRAVTLDATEFGPVLTRVFDHNGEAWPQTAESQLGTTADDEHLEDVIDVPVRAIPGLAKVIPLPVPRRDSVPFLPEAA